MDWNRVEGNWKQFKGQVKEKWGNLTDDDLDKIEGSSRSTGGNNPGAVWNREGSSQERRRHLAGIGVTHRIKPTRLQKRTSQRCPLFLGRFEAMAPARRDH